MLDWLKRNYASIYWWGDVLMTIFVLALGGAAGVVLWAMWLRAPHPIAYVVYPVGVALAVLLVAGLREIWRD